MAPTGDFAFALNLGGTGFDRGVAVATDGAGNVYEAGLFEGTASIAPGVTLTSTATASASDIFLAKFDNGGTLDWVKQIGTSDWDEPTDVLVDRSGFVYLAGYTNRGTGFLTKYDSAGTSLWTRTLGAIASAIAIDGTGNLYLTGSFTLTVNLNPNGTPADTHTSVGGNPNVFVEKIDQNGNDLWSRVYGNAAGENGVDIAVDGAGNVYTTGLYRGTVNFNPTGTAVNLTAPAASPGCDVYLLKLDTDGNLDWVGNLGGAGSNEPGGIAVDSAGNVYTTGFFQNSGDFDPGTGTTILTSAGGWDIYLEKVDTDGHLVWANAYGSTDIDEGWDVTVAGTGLYLTGNYGGTVDFDPGPNVNTLTSGTAGNAGNALVARYETTTGALDWARSLGSSGNENGFGIAVDRLSSVFTTGQFAGTAEDFDPSPTATYRLGTTGINDLNAYVSKLTQPPEAPIATGDTYNVAKGMPLVVAAPGVLANDTDTLGGVLTAALVTSPGHGTVTLNADGSFRYTPNGLYLGTDSFTYDASDGSALSNIVTVALTVSGADDPPVAGDDQFSVNENGGLTASAPGVLANDTDPNGDPITAVLATGPAHGSLTLSSSGTFTYIPSTNFFGTDSFSYQASDGQLLSSAATVTITVNHVNQPPVAQSDTYAVSKNTALAVPAASGVLANDSDPDPGQTLSAVLVSGPIHGALSFNADGSFTYTPAANYLGIDGFSYKATDGSLYSAIVAVNLAVSGPDDPPTAVNDAFTINENSTLSAGFNYVDGILGNDTDPNGQLLNAIEITPPAHGTLALASSGAMTYTPNTGFYGTDTFTYQASDGTLLSNVATVTITVKQVIYRPTAVADTYTTSENTALQVPAPGILGNDSDPNGLAITPVVTSRTAHGTLTVHPDGSFTYVPNTYFWGTDSFNYYVTDGKATSLYVTDSITVAHVNQAPIVADDAYTAQPNASLVSGPSVTAVTMTSQAGDFVGQGQSYNFTPSNSTITAWVRSGGVYTNAVEIDVSTPSGEFWTLDFAAPDYARLLPGTYNNATRWPFQAAGVPGLDVSGDGRGSNTLTGQFTVTQALYDAQGNIRAFAADFVQHSEGATPALSGQVLWRSSYDKPEGVLFNDSDPDNDPITAALVAGPSHGTLAFNADGSFSYTPDAGYSGPDSFTYTAGDGTLTSKVATARITVLGPPGVVDDMYRVMVDSPCMVAAPGVLGNDTDWGGQALASALVTGPAHGSLTLNPDGSFAYTPQAGFRGADTFTYTAGDGTYVSPAATVTLSVGGAGIMRVSRRPLSVGASLPPAPLPAPALTDRALAELVAPRKDAPAPRPVVAPVAPRPLAVLPTDLSPVTVLYAPGTNSSKRGSAVGKDDSSLAP